MHTYTRQELTLTANNLTTLAMFIEQRIPESKINMEYYRTEDGGDFAYFHSMTECGSSGCELGWSPFAPNMEPKPDHFKFDGITDPKTGEQKLELQFSRYGSHHYPSLYDKDGYNHTNKEWSHVFDETLSSEKSEVIQRLRDKAKELNDRAEHMTDPA